MNCTLTFVSKAQIALRDFSSCTQAEPRTRQSSFFFDWLFLLEGGTTFFLRVAILSVALPSYLYL